MRELTVTSLHGRAPGIPRAGADCRPVNRPAGRTTTGCGRRMPNSPRVPRW